MSLFCLIRVISSSSNLYKARELFPLIQFFALTYVWTDTAYYKQYSLLAMISMSIIFYLINGKIVLAFVTQSKMKLFHLELLYLLLPAGILIAEKARWIDSKTCDDLQVKAGILILILHIERFITYSMSIIMQVTKYLGFGFFEIPKKK